MVKTPGGKFWLEVQGLAERRPSVVIGDIVRVMSTHGPQLHDGYVHAVERDRALLSFAPKVAHQHVTGTKYKVTFCLTRTNLRLRHRAVLKASDSTLAAILPDHDNFKSEIAEPDPGLQVLDGQLNPQQQLAVRAVLSRNDPQPFVIFGPPGTGKTKTVVAAVCQVS